MDNITKNEIIKLYLENKLSQSEIGRKFSVKQPAVSKIISAYKNGKFIYNDTTVDEQPPVFAPTSTEPVAEYEQTISPINETVEPTISTLDETIKNENEPITTETENTECEQNVSSVSIEFDTEPVEFPTSAVAEYEKVAPHIDTPVATITSSQTDNTAECEQENSTPLLNKSKITFTNHGLWLNQFALKQLNNPIELAYSFDNENSKLYIEPVVENNVNPFYYCKAKCSKNYTKTANNQLINDIQEILEHEFKGNIDVNLNKDSFKINFKFNYENGQFIIHIPTMISNVDFEVY